MGTGPLLYLAASQYAKAGARVAAVLDTSPALSPARELAGLLAKPALLLKGLAIVAGLRARGIPVKAGITPVAIEGEGASGVTGFAWRDRSGGAHRLECDAVAMGWHLRPETPLAELAGASFAWDALTGQWLPEVDADGRIAAKGVYLAGDGARVLGADAAEDGGRLAALAALADLGLAFDASQPPRLRERLAHHRRFADAPSRAPIRGRRTWRRTCPTPPSCAGARVSRPAASARRCRTPAPPRSTARRRSCAWAWAAARAATARTRRRR